MNKTYISSLLVVLIGAQTIRAQESLDDVFAQLDAAEGTPAAVMAAEPAAMEMAPVVEQAAPGGNIFDRGVAYYKAGKYDEAEAVFSMLLAKDPYNRKAMVYLKRTAQKIAANEAIKQNSSRAKALAEIDAAWNPAPSALVAPVGMGEEKTKSPEQMAVEAMTARLQDIVIPSLDFRDANIKDVVLFLTETCRRLDAGGKGVNILLLGMEGSEAADQNNITISIRDMNLYEALQFIVEMASLKFEVKARAVTISPVNWVAEVDMVMKSYDVIPEVGSEMEAMSGGDGGGADDLFGDASASADTGPVDVAGFFSIVDFPEGASAVYQPNFHKLFVKNTPKNIKGVEAILADLEDEAIAKRSQQVEIEAKFVEFSEGALEEMGFDWTIEGSGNTLGMKFKEGSRAVTDPNGITTYDVPYSAGTPGQNLFGANQRNNQSAFAAIDSGLLGLMGGTPGSMLFTDGTFDLELSAMEQEGTADILSAPRVTTKSGSEAIIRVVEVHRYPQDYDVETGQRTSPVVKPQDWEDYDLGVVLKVTPIVDAESNTIDLQLEPEITSFKGYDQYKVGSNAYESGGNNSSELFGDGNDLIANMPFFETRTIQTEVTVADGSTLLMGGLVDERTETFRDQVPILGDIPYVGRLFRTEGSRSEKVNLVIYVKATQVDDRGMTRADREMARQAAAN